MKPWQLGNTSVRSATRLRDGLVVLSESGREGMLRGREGDEAWRAILGEAGVVTLGADESNSVGRKWRAAMGRLGFVYEDLGKIQSQVGPLDFITPNGHRLISAESAAAQQECHLRAISGMWLDVSTPRHKMGGSFSPLRHVLRVMKTVESLTQTSGISAVEFELFVQTTADDTEPAEIAQSILAYRSGRGHAVNKRGFDNAALHLVALEQGSVHESTYRDYMDMNLRYLKSTGLFRAYGRGIMFSDRKSVVIDGLMTSLEPPASLVAFWTQLTEGAILPTDNQAEAIAAFESVSVELSRRGIPEDRQVDQASVADLQVARFELEERLSLDDEEQFSLQQRLDWEEIARFMDLVPVRRSRTELEDEIRVPSGEAPAYFEWTIWRAFLAINSLKNKPNEARRFLVDQDMRPLGCAPGGGPDLIFEFDDFTLVVEVTLTTSVRQEAAEGVPVRQHVHQETVRRPGQRVYGLFLAPTLVPSTLETFRAGTYFAPELEGLSAPVSIVPVKLKTFHDLFIAMFVSGNSSPKVLIAILKKCLEVAPNIKNPLAWEREIDGLFSQSADELLQGSAPK